MIISSNSTVVVIVEVVTILVSCFLICFVGQL